jgi:hypothetical protein
VFGAPVSPERDSNRTRASPYSSISVSGVESFHLSPLLSVAVEAALLVCVPDLDVLLCFARSARSDCASFSVTIFFFTSRSSSALASWACATIGAKSKLVAVAMKRQGLINIQFLRCGQAPLVATRRNWNAVVTAVWRVCNNRVN